MASTLGEKLRQAREDRGLTIGEVAEQTRISPLYLESIENNDYSTLPGGIFNKGFLKSYAKFVGVDEQEALADYTRLIADTPISEEVELKLYKPEVLTDDRTSASMVPTVIMAVVLLGLLTVGVLYLVEYVRRPSAELPPANTSKPAVAVNSNSGTSDQSGAPASESPEMATVKVELKTLGQPVRIAVTKDGVKTDRVYAAGSSEVFEPKDSITINYNRWNGSAVQLLINGKNIALPSEPLKGSADKGRIEFTISRENLGQIWNAGAISPETTPANTDSNSNTVPASPAPAPVSSQPAKTPAPKTAQAANTAGTPKPTVKPATTEKPAAVPAKPANTNP